jgi:hypothetical protein
MLKPNANFKMSKQSKRFLATIIDPKKRAESKRSFIQAELGSLLQPRVSKGKNKETVE